VVHFRGDPADGVVYQWCCMLAHACMIA
jgi:hypothetical protein